MTHGLTHLSKADQIICMKNGRVTEIGTYSQLLSHNGAFAELIWNYLNERDSDSESDLDPEGTYSRVFWGDVAPTVSLHCFLFICWDVAPTVSLHYFLFVEAALKAELRRQISSLSEAENSPAKSASDVEESQKLRRRIRCGI